MSLTNVSSGIKPKVANNSQLVKEVSEKKLLSELHVDNLLYIH